MLGAIVGDIIGSAYEFNRIKTRDFELFTPETMYTDDTVLTVAVADHLLNNKGYINVYKEYPRKYVRRRYGQRFYVWANINEAVPYNSLGNGSAMRVSPIGWAFDTLEETLIKAKESAEPTHNHPEGVKGAQAVASAIYLARIGNTKDEIQQYIESNFGYTLDESVDDIRNKAYFDETCPVSVPQAISCFLQSDSYEDAVRNAVSLGADADTQAAIAGSIAEAFYKEIPESLISKSRELLHIDLWNIIDKFHSKYINLHSGM
jgi:ADP-ribosylglycohydrolase